MKKNIELITLFLLSGVQFYEEVSGSSDALPRRSLAIRNAERTRLRRKSFRERVSELRKAEGLLGFNELEAQFLDACLKENVDEICLFLGRIIGGAPIDLRKFPFPNGVLIDMMRMLCPIGEEGLLPIFGGLLGTVPYDPLILDENGENCVQIARRLGFCNLAQLFLDSFRSAVVPLHIRGAADGDLMQVEAAFSDGDLDLVVPIVWDFVSHYPGEALKMRFSNGNTLLMQVLEMEGGSLVPSLMEDGVLKRVLGRVPYNPYQRNDGGENASDIARRLGLSAVVPLLEESMRERRRMDGGKILGLLLAMKRRDMPAVAHYLTLEGTHCPLDILLMADQFPDAFRGLPQVIVAEGLTLFMYAVLMACMDGNSDLVVLLLDMGVNPAIRNKAGKCALAIVRELLEADSLREALPFDPQASAEIIELLGAFDDDGIARALSLKSIREGAVEERLKRAIMGGKMKTALAIITNSKDLDLRWQDEGGDTSLMWIMQTVTKSEDVISLAKAILDRVAEMLGREGALAWARETVNNDRETVLDMALNRGDLEPIVQILLSEEK
ncbi:MAG: ankyrin repeat domain-containing protein [Puniceicoccales bacterium]|jgi:hypothetical protein|nr:ankyrin repeat domain-containing protein [Puniceicoccales bacterium]